jgi:GntR family transcriptional regulator / MocR family aminotransferase
MTYDRTSTEPELLLPLDRESAMPLRVQLEGALRAAIRSGRLAPESRLPSSRALARDLGVSRGVVVEAYAQLIAEGYVVSRAGGSTTVAPALVPPEQPPDAGAVTVPPRYNFRPGVPDPGLFPRAAWAAALRHAVREAPDAALGYSDPRGVPALRTALAAYLGRVRGVVTDPDTIVVCSGFAQGLGLLCRELRAGGMTRIGVEDPCQPDLRALIARRGMESIPVPIDDEGLRVDALARTGVQAVLVTPAHQFPSGVVLAPARRAALVAWAQEHDGLIVEDDYDAEYRYDRVPVGAVQGLAPERVVYCGSVSKTLAPALRLGWLALPRRLAPALAEAKRLDDLGSPALDQLAFAHLLETGALDRHLRRARLHYRARRDALVAALARHLPRARPRGIAAGLHLVVDLPPGTDEDAVVEAGRARGVNIYGMRGYYLENRHTPPALALGYGALPEPGMDAGVRELSQIVAASRQSSPRRYLEFHESSQPVRHIRERTR